ncbi:hypothetical protein Bca101_019151 [Brassica carinata]
MQSRDSTHAATETTKPGDNTERGSSSHAPTTENQPQDLTKAKRIRMKPRNRDSNPAKKRPHRREAKDEEPPGLKPHQDSTRHQSPGPRKMMVILRRSEQTGERIDAGSSTFLSTVLLTNVAVTPDLPPRWPSLPDPPRIEKKLEAANSDQSFNKDRKEEDEADGAKRKRNKGGAPDDGQRNHHRRNQRG